ncbi:MAG: ribosome recycling factor [Elusimicrobiota bacterium]
MKKTIEKLLVDLSTVRTGRASPTLLDPVRVPYYGSTVPVSQVGNIVVADARTIEIRPWDVKVLHDLEKAIIAANIGVNPNSDGKIMRLVFPPLTEERRRDLVKLVKKIAEDFKVSLRNERRDAIEQVKTLEKNKEITLDQKKQAEEKVQHLTDASIKKIDEIVVLKEKEILEV